MIDQRNFQSSHSLGSTCWYCGQEIAKIPYVSRGGHGRSRTKHYHIECAVKAGLLELPMQKEEDGLEFAAE